MTFWLGVLANVLEMAIGAVVYMLIIRAIRSGHKHKDILSELANLIERRCEDILTIEPKKDSESQSKS